MADLSKNVANMIKCAPGEHCLFRSFGVGEVDAPTRLTRNALQVEVNKWLPSVTIQSLSVDNVTPEGYFEYSIQIKGE